MPAEMRENLIEEILEVHKFVERNSIDVSHETNPSVLRAAEVIEDIKVKITCLISKFLAAPITGRLCLPHPTSYVPVSEQVKSVKSQLLLDDDN